MARALSVSQVRHSINLDQSNPLQWSEKLFFTVKYFKVDLERGV